ncbi:hypothetical protein JCM6882_001330 [Rhodosporidiobolus microsporus]
MWFMLLRSFVWTTAAVLCASFFHLVEGVPTPSGKDSPDTSQATEDHGLDNSTCDLIIILAIAGGVAVFYLSLVCWAAWEEAEYCDCDELELERQLSRAGVKHALVHFFLFPFFLAVLALLVRPSPYVSPAGLFLLLALYVALAQSIVAAAVYLVAPWSKQLVWSFKAWRAKENAEDEVEEQVDDAKDAVGGALGKVKLG